MNTEQEFRLPRAIKLECEQFAPEEKVEQYTELVTQAAFAASEERYSDAHLFASQAKSLSPRAPSPRELLGIAAYHQERWADVVREVRAFKRLSDRRDLDHLLADAERALGRPEKALEVLSGIKPVDVGEEVFIEILIAASGAFNELGEHERAYELINSHGNLRPAPVLERHLRLWYVLADTLEMLDRREEASGWWDLIFAEDPEFFDVATRRLGMDR